MADVRNEADRVLQTTSDLRVLRDRLAELDAERVALEQKIQQKLTEVGGVPAEDTGQPRSVVEEVFAFLRRHPNTVYAAVDIARELSVTSHADVNNLRSALWRLNARRKIEKVSFGRYILKM